METHVTSERRYTEKEAADLIGISKVTLSRRRGAGEIGFYRVGIRVFYSESHLARFLERCEQNGTFEIVDTTGCEGGQS
jgi:excisionase family DNA binding protein